MVYLIDIIDMRPEKNPLGFSFDFKPKNLILREESPVDEFYKEPVTPAFDNQNAVCIHNPLYILFNSERLELGGSFAVDKWIEQLNQASSRFDSFKDLRSKCSDDELMQFMKSRYVQQPCEIEAWASYINENYDKMSTEIQEYIAANKQSTDTSATTQTSSTSE